jgi:glycosyltransferase involved in cell wall biosynthesis
MRAIDEDLVRKLQLENNALRGEIQELRDELKRGAKMVENAEAKSIRLSQLLRENIQLSKECNQRSQEIIQLSLENDRRSQENIELSQLLSEANRLNEKMRRSWVWLPLKPFRWLESAIRQRRKKFQAKYLPGKPAEARIAPPLPVQSPGTAPWGDSVENYKRWLELCEQYGFEAAKDTAREMASLTYQPLISILMPVRNTPERFLRKAIDSVLNQSYGSWQLCIADDASTVPHVKNVLLDYAQLDSRISIVFRERNGHISLASNSALELARGEFSAVLDHDDELTPDALSSVIRELNGHPDANLVYSDYDEIDRDGLRRSTCFKPGWNPDLLLSQNYICHLAVYRTDLLRKLEGFRPGFEGSQDWDLSLRVSEASQSGQIRHIPKILYHWRRHEHSASSNLSSTHYAVIAAEKAITEHLARKQRKAKVMETPFTGWFRVRYEIENPPKVSIIICTRDRIDLLRPCIKSILGKTSYQSYEILIVDNNSREPDSRAFFDEYRNHPRVRVIEDDREFNYSALNNRAVSHATGSVLCFLNNDTVVISSEWLEELVSHAVREEIGAVGAKLLFPDGRIQHAGIVLGVGGFAGHVFAGLPEDAAGHMGRAQLIQNYTAVTGACMAMRKSLFLDAGGFNESELKISFNDIDLCLRLHAAGYRNLWTPYALLYHHAGASRGEDITPGQKELALREANYFHTRWKDLIYDDPAYNPNLSLSIADGGMALPRGNHERVPSLLHIPG